MKKAVLWTLWAAIPVAALAFHLGPGQKLGQKDVAASHIAAAEKAFELENWQLALDEYSKARGVLPDDAAKVRDTIELAEAKTRLEGGDFFEAGNQLEALLEKEEAKAAPDEEFLRQIREQIGQTAYYSAWVMRLEGAAPEEWRIETTRARQQYRYLGETVADTSFKKTSTDNLEAVVRLEQMDISELRGLPLPKKCENCSNCSGKKREQRMSKSNAKKPNDARDQIKKDAASAATSSGKGS